MTDDTKSVQQLVDAVVMAIDARALTKEQRHALNTALIHVAGKELNETMAQLGEAFKILRRKD